METQTLATNKADIVYDVRGSLPTADGRPPLCAESGYPGQPDAFARKLREVLSQDE